MKKHILIRRIPDHVESWIESERQKSLMTRQEFLVTILDRASQARQLSFLETKDPDLEDKILPAPFTFIDLFSGIGGFRIGLQRAGGRCVFSCEWDRYAQKTYNAWFGEVPEGDIRSISPKDIPDHDIMAAGFPCQPFSIAGVSKKKSLGRDHGFDFGLVDHNRITRTLSAHYFKDSSDILISQVKSTSPKTCLKVFNTNDADRS